MKFAFAVMTAVLVASAASGQSAKLVIEPSHGKMIQEYVVTEHLRPVTVSVPLELGATIPDGLQLEPVPLGLVARVPEVRNYEYFTAGGKVVFVEPYTRRIAQIVQ
ncbi:MAG TPA: DUF1236 domain-containing protein [Rhizomicrobium sp.]|jgi:hypothetical protein|nr:DUF1236 domain-containing protein [Rhizomicrobium sp.]